MKVGVLFSGGKDSTYSAFWAKQEGYEISCLINIVSENKESFMFHTPNIKLAKIQAQVMEIPILIIKTKGEKEKELEDLKRAIMEAKEKYGLLGIVSGALASKYQFSRIKKICDGLGLKCLNPLWGKNIEKYWETLLENGFKIMIISVSSEGLEEKWLGKIIGEEELKELKKLCFKFKFHLGFEGGEAETFVLDCPLFKKELKILKAKKEWKRNSGTYKIEKIRIIKKEYNEK